MESLFSVVIVTMNRKEARSIFHAFRENRFVENRRVRLSRI